MPIFWKNNKNTTNLSSAEFAKRAGNIVKFILCLFPLECAKDYPLALHIKINRELSPVFLISPADT